MMQSDIIIKMNLLTHNFQITLKEKNQWKAYTVNDIKEFMIYFL